MLEHRWIMDPGPDLQVHHRNHVRTDNRPENLEVVEPKEHFKRHRKVDDDDLVRLHNSGMNATQVAREVGMHSSQVWRRLNALGQPLGRVTVNKVEADVDEIVRRHDAGERANWIADEMGLPVAVVRNRLRSAGRRGINGRPPQNARG